MCGIRPESDRDDPVCGSYPIIHLFSRLSFQVFRSKMWRTSLCPESHPFMNITENICPACKESNDLEAVVCARCGAVLEDPFLDPGFQTQITHFAALTSEVLQGWPVDETTAPDHGIAIYLEGEAKPAYIESRTEFVIGRKVGATSQIPQDLLDLSPLGAYGQGLSRQHVRIRRTKNGYEILDLGSANGTWLNEARLLPNQYHLLASGSHLRLGSMRLFVLYRPVTATGA